MKSSTVAMDDGHRGGETGYGGGTNHKWLSNCVRNNGIQHRHLLKSIAGCESIPDGTIVCTGDGSFAGVEE